MRRFATHAAVAAALAAVLAAAWSSPPTFAAQPRGESLIVLLKSAAVAAVLDPATGGTRFQVETGAGPHEVVTSPDGRYAVVADYGTGPAPGRTLTVVDLSEQRVARTIDLGEYRRPHGLQWIPGTRRVVVTCEQNMAVLVVDVTMGHVEFAISTGERGTHMVEISRDGRWAWTPNIGSGTVSLLDLIDKRLVKTAKVGSGPEAIALSPDGREVWVGDRQLNRVTILDARTLDSLGALPTGEFPNRAKFTPDGRRVLVSNARSGTIAVYDAARRQRLADIVIPYDTVRARDQMLGAAMGRSAVPLGILMHPGGRRAWVALAATDQVAVLDLDRLVVERLIDVGREPDGMALIDRR